MNERVKIVIEWLKDRRIILKQEEFADKIGMQASQLSETLSGKRDMNERVIHKIVAAFSDISTEWLLTGEGEMLKKGSIQKAGDIDARGNRGFAGNMSGGVYTLHNDEGKDKVIEKQEQQVLHMFEAFMVELRGFHEYTQRQDDHLDNIVKKSYLRNERNMERIDKLFEQQKNLIEQQNSLIQLISNQNERTQQRADKMIDLLEKKLQP